MKKTTITVTTLALLAILSCGIVIHLSCNKPDCSDCPQLTSEEMSFVCYRIQGENVIFKNDTTSVFDTLTVGNTVTSPSGCSSPCDGPNMSMEAFFSFSHLFAGFYIYLYHNQPPFIHFNAKHYYSFPLNVSTQTVTVNSSTYNDVYSVLIDSTTIVTEDKQRVPWKIYYSKSQGFVRFYMINGHTWSKL